MSGIVGRPQKLPIGEYDSVSSERALQKLYENDIRLERKIGEVESSALDTSSLDAIICANSCVQANTAGVANNAAGIAINAGNIATNTTSISDILAGNTEVFVYGQKTFVDVRNGSTQSVISSSTPQLINYDTVGIDNLSEWDSVAKRFNPTIPAATTYYYLVTCAVGFNSTFTAARFGIYIYTTSGIFTFYDQQWTGTAPFYNISAIVPLSTGQWMDFRVLQLTGSNKTIPVYALTPRVVILRIA